MSPTRYGSRLPVTQSHTRQVENPIRYGSSCVRFQEKNNLDERSPAHIFNSFKTLGKPPFCSASSFSPGFTTKRRQRHPFRGRTLPASAAAARASPDVSAPGSLPSPNTVLRVDCLGLFLILIRLSLFVIYLFC
jgi:hypothetical protein